MKGPKATPRVVPPPGHCPPMGLPHCATAQPGALPPSGHWWPITRGGAVPPQPAGQYSYPRCRIQLRGAAAAGGLLGCSRGAGLQRGGCARQRPPLGPPNAPGSPPNPPPPLGAAIGRLGAQGFAPPAGPGHLMGANLPCPMHLQQLFEVCPGMHCTGVLGNAMGGFTI